MASVRGARQGMASVRASGSEIRNQGARETRDEGRSDFALSVTLSAALETRSAIGIALYRLPRASPSLPDTLSVLGEYVGR
jgi:hypothetical protein